MVAWTVWIMLAAGVIAGGLFNVIWLSGVRNQAHNCASAAAIAAGHGYLSDDMLRSWQQPFEYEGRVARCKGAAIDMVNQYRNKSTLPEINEEQVIVDWNEEQGPAADPAMLVPERICVSFDSEDERFQVRTFFSGLTGLDSSRLGVCSSVRLEHSPVAFRPGPKANVPMLPFAICDDVLPVVDAETPAASGYWTQNIESGTGRDSYSWNDDARLFELGPDGIPEVTVTIYSTSSVGNPDAFIPMSFAASDGRAGSQSQRILHWIQNGLAADDLETLGLTEIKFPGSMPMLSLSPQELTSCVAALQSRAGQPLLVCLCSIGADSAGEDSANVTSLTNKRPVAVRIVQVTSSVSGSVKVTLQPCVLTTSTAITSPTPELALNRYVYSVRLCD
jgi:hypothetical protein